MSKTAATSGLGVRDLGFRVWDLGFRVWDLGFRVWDLGFRVWDLGFRVWDLGFRAQHLEVQADLPGNSNMPARPMGPTTFGKYFNSNVKPKP